MVSLRVVSAAVRYFGSRCRSTSEGCRHYTVVNKCTRVYSSTTYPAQLPYYQKRGDGSHAILCIPGALGSSQTDFGPQLEYFGHDNGDYAIVGYDPSGYGYSRPPERKFEVDPVSFYTLDAHDGFKVMEHLNFHKFSVLGWSDGGISAIILAALYPESVTKLVVWGSNAYVTEHDLELFEKVRDISAWSHTMRKPLEDLYGTTSFQLLWSKWIDAMQSIRSLNSGDLCVHECAKVQCPTLIVHGAKDAMCPQFHAQYLRDHIRCSQLKVFPEGKHNLHLKYSYDFNKIVENFLLE